MDFLKDGVDIRGTITSLKEGKIGTGGDAHFYDDNQAPSKVRQNLASSKEADKIKGMKWLLANLSKGKDVSEFFPDVVKNVVVKSVEVKKMVYNYLVHYADFDSSCRENSLLSINSFQNDLNGTNQLIRGLALRVMTSIRFESFTRII
jgi:AP-3 complex subunit beta